MDLANIIALVSSHNADPTTTPDIIEEEITHTVVKRGAIVEKVAAPIQGAPAPKVMALPQTGTLDAQGFMKAARSAKGRNEMIAAIAAYCGYSHSGNFGTQEQEARAKAMREIRGVNTAGPSRAEQRAAARSVAGFVHGMPDPSQRILANLRARETAAVEAMLSAKSDSEKAAHKVVLDQIQKAIDEMVG